MISAKAFGSSEGKDWVRLVSDLTHQMVGIISGNGFGLRTYTKQMFLATRYCLQNNFGDLIKTCKASVVDDMEH